MRGWHRLALPWALPGSHWAFWGNEAPGSSYITYHPHRKETLKREQLHRKEHPDHQPALSTFLVMLEPRAGALQPLEALGTGPPTSMLLHGGTLHHAQRPTL